MRRAKIVATLGPASREPAALEALLHAGCNTVRINMSHGTQAEHAETILRARRAAANVRRPLAVLVDLCGPKIRTGTLKDGISVRLEENQIFTITNRKIVGDAHEVSTNYADMPRVVKRGSRLLIDDGLIELEVEDANDTDITCRVINGGTLSERKGINLPGVQLPIPSLTDKDKVDLEWAVGQRADYIALSFVRQVEDITEAKSLIKQHGGRAPLVAKIEKAEAIDNLTEIIEATDGVMVARGDLGVETSVELVPVYQKRIITEANMAGKFVITATQMLQSMVDNPRPTRAESSDVANAVWDGTDALMLSAETATGAYAVSTVATMARIIESAEIGYTRSQESPAKRYAGRQSGRVSRALCEAAAFAAEEINAKLIAVFTESGLMARRLSALRPMQRIIALTNSQDVCNELAPIWGVEPLLHPTCNSTERLIGIGERVLIENGIVEAGEQIVLMAGRLSGLELSSSVKVHTIGENPN